MIYRSILVISLYNSIKDYFSCFSSILYEHIFRTIISFIITSGLINVFFTIFVNLDANFFYDLCKVSSIYCLYQNLHWMNPSLSKYRIYLTIALFIFYLKAISFSFLSMSCVTYLLQILRGNIEYNIFRKVDLELILSFSTSIICDRSRSISG